MSQRGANLGLSRDVYCSFEFCFLFACLTNGNVAKLRTHNGDETPNSAENQMASHVARIE